MEITNQIIEAMKTIGKPMSAGQISEAIGADRKDVDKAMKKMKTDGSIVSPKNCYWEPAK